MCSQHKGNYGGVRHRSEYALCVFYTCGTSLFGRATFYRPSGHKGAGGDPLDRAGLPWAPLRPLVEGAESPSFLETSCFSVLEFRGYWLHLAQLVV